jgi:hypothetical protein
MMQITGGCFLLLVFPCLPLSWGTNEGTVREKGLIRVPNRLLLQCKDRSGGQLDWIKAFLQANDFPR